MYTYTLYVYHVEPLTLEGYPADRETELLKAESNDLVFIGDLYDYYKSKKRYKVVWYRNHHESHVMGSVTPYPSPPYPSHLK